MILRPSPSTNRPLLPGGGKRLGIATLASLAGFTLLGAGGGTGCDGGAPDESGAGGEWTAPGGGGGSGGKSPWADRDAGPGAAAGGAGGDDGQGDAGGAAGPLPAPGEPGFAADAFTLALLPDTQYYSLSYPGIYLAQVSWIVANVQSLQIPYVLHLGDIVDQNTPLEWERATQAMGLLEGVVPYTIAPGNHDLGPGGSASTRDTLLNQYFSYPRTAAWPTFGGAYQAGRLENTFHLFSAGGRDYIVLALEWGPRDEVIAWANQVMADHPDRYGVLVTHAYLNNDDLRYDITDLAHPQDFNPYQYDTAGGVNDGEQLWQKLVRKHAFVLVLNGHVLGDGTGYLASVTDKGNTCHQMLSNYQFRAEGGEGYMRLLEFQADQRTIKVLTYSPLYDRFLTEADQSFTITLDVPVGPAP